MKVYFGLLYISSNDIQGPHYSDGQRDRSYKSVNFINTTDKDKMCDFPVEDVTNCVWQCIYTRLVRIKQVTTSSLRCAVSSFCFICPRSVLYYVTTCKYFEKLTRNNRRAVRWFIFDT
jgi:hypothetical protein